MNQHLVAATVVPSPLLTLTCRFNRSPPSDKASADALDSSNTPRDRPRSRLPLCQQHAPPEFPRAFQCHRHRGDDRRATCPVKAPPFCNKNTSATTGPKPMLCLTAGIRSCPASATGGVNINSALHNAIAEIWKYSLWSQQPAYYGFISRRVFQRENDP